MPSNKWTGNVVAGLWTRHRRCYDRELLAEYKFVARSSTFLADISGAMHKVAPEVGSSRRIESLTVSFDLQPNYVQYCNCNYTVPTLASYLAS